MRGEFDQIIYDEEAILDGIRNGNKEVYRHIFENYFKVLVLYAISLTNDKLRAEDLVQNVLMSLWLKREGIKIQSSLKSYLYKSIHNLFINEYRREERKCTILEQIHYEVLQQSIEEEELYMQMRLEWINKEIELLPPKSKEIFVMNKKRGLSYKEISNILGISENTVESHIGRAMKRIRKNIPKKLLILIFCK